MIKITEIQIKRFRSINDLTLKIDPDFNISTICGQNNVGKTNVLTALNLFFEKKDFNFQDDVPEFKQKTRGAAVYPLISIKFIDDKSNDEFQISKDYNLKKIPDDFINPYYLEGTKNNTSLLFSECSKFLEKINVFYLPSINISFPETINLLIDDKFLDIEFGNSRMKGQKGIVKKSLQKARNVLQKVLDDLTDAIDPSFKEFHHSWGIKFKVPQSINRFREILNNEIEFVITDDTQSEIKTKGAGLQRLGHLLLNLRIIEKLSIKSKNCILLIDEPDIYLHSSLQKKLNKKLKDISKNAQIVLTTHSPIFIDSYKMKNVFLLELNVEEKYSARKKQKSNSLNTELIDLSLSDSVFLIKETLGIEDRDSLLIGRNNLIVEGDEDKQYISELIKYFGLQNCNIISAGGASNIVKYLEYYNSIWEGNCSDKPKFKVLFDNDDEGRTQYKIVKKKSDINFFEKLDVRPKFIIDAQKSDFDVNIKHLNIEIEDFIYPEIILELSNKIFSKKKGFKKIRGKTFFKNMANKSLKYNGVLSIINNLKNESNPEVGLNLSTTDSGFKGGLSNLFNIKGNIEMINLMNGFDDKYPEVKNFLLELTND